MGKHDVRQKGINAYTRACGRARVVARERVKVVDVLLPLWGVSTRRARETDGVRAAAACRCSSRRGWSRRRPRRARPSAGQLVRERREERRAYTWWWHPLVDGDDVRCVGVLHFAPVGRGGARVVARERVPVVDVLGPLDINQSGAVNGREDCLRGRAAPLGRWK